MYPQTKTPEENTKFVETKLADFDSLLEKVPSEKKAEYLNALEKCPDECSDDFKIAFLRCEVFNVQPAVDRWCNYWNARIRLFGAENAYRSIQANRLDDEEVQRHNYAQIASKADVDGRSIVLVDYQQEGLDVTDDALVRSVWYSMHQALQKESAQQRGIVVFVRCVKSLVDWRISVSMKCISNIRGVLPVRLAGIHIVNPPLFIRVILKVLKKVIGKKLGKRIYLHSGQTEDVLCSLSKFELGTAEMYPTLFGGLLEFS